MPADAQRVKESPGRAGAFNNCRRSPEGREGPDPLDAPDIIPKHKSDKARIEAPIREARSSPPAHQGARVIRTDALRFVLILREPRDGQERKQDSEDDPDINAHQSGGSHKRSVR